jgi:hypothetical protein
LLFLWTVVSGMVAAGIAGCQNRGRAFGRQKLLEIRSATGKWGDYFASDSGGSSEFGSTH